MSDTASNAPRTVEDASDTLPDARFDDQASSNAGVDARIGRADARVAGVDDAVALDGARFPRSAEARAAKQRRIGVGVIDKARPSGRFKPPLFAVLRHAQPDGSRVPSDLREQHLVLDAASTKKAPLSG